MRWSLLPVALLALALTACPEERPGATKEIPPQRIPPAMAIEPQRTPPASSVQPTPVPGVAPVDTSLTSRPPPPRRP